jgi:hypothetical protein
MRIDGCKSAMSAATKLRSIFCYANHEDGMPLAVVARIGLR